MKPLMNVEANTMTEDEPENPGRLDVVCQPNAINKQSAMDSNAKKKMMVDSWMRLR